MEDILSNEVCMVEDILSYEVLYSGRYIIIYEVCLVEDILSYEVLYGGRYIII